MNINEEIDNLADKMEKSVVANTISLETLENTIKTLGVAGLKKAASNLTDSQKIMLKSVLDGMARDRKVTTEPASNTTKGGDERYNTEDKAPYDEQDEKIAKDAEKKDQQTPKNQGGGAPVEGWEGQVIKSKDMDEAKDKIIEMEEKEHGTKDPKKLVEAEKKENEIEKGGPNSGRKPMVPGLAGVQSVVNMHARAEDEAKIKEKFNEQAGENKPASKKEEKKEMAPETIAKAKENFKSMIQRMQDRKMPKEESCAAVAKSIGSTSEAVAKVWDVLAKGDILPEKGNPEGKQSEPAEIMKNGKEPAKKEPLSGKAHNKADEGEQPPKPMAKSTDGYWHVEEEVYLAKSAANPFAHRTIKPNACYNVDSFIEAAMTNQKDRLAKSTFDYDNEGEALVKGMDPAAMDTAAVVNQNAKKQAQSKKDDKDEIKDIKINEKLTRIEDHAGPKMPMLKSEEAPAEAAEQDKVPSLMKKKKSKTEEMIEKGLTMDQSQYDAALAVKKSKAQGAFVVKSFSDAEMDELFADTSMWSDK